MTQDKFSETAETAWDEAAGVHKKYRYNQLLNGFKQPGFASMPAVRQDILLKHGVKGRSAFQPCCNNGRDILSLKNLGATQCLGFDISSEFIEQGKQFAQAGGIDCELIRADTYDLDSAYDGLFDIGLISLGTMMWLQDLDAFFSVVARLMRQGGWLLIHELHPIYEMLSVNPSTKQMMISGDYFNDSPRLVTGGLDYFGGESYDATPCYRFLHKISDVVEAVVNNGLKIETFEERAEDMSSGVFRGRFQGALALPLSYTLTAIK